MFEQPKDKPRQTNIMLSIKKKKKRQTDIIVQANPNLINMCKIYYKILDTFHLYLVNHPGNTNV